MMLVRAGVLLCLLAAAGCGSTPSGGPLTPSSSSFTQLLPDGRYLFSINTLPGRPGCAPAWEPTVHAARAGEMLIRREGNEWIGRVDNALGGLDLRIYFTGGTRIAGTIRGVLVTAIGSGPDGVGTVISLGASFGDVNGGGRFLSGDLPFGSSGHGRVEGGVTIIDRGRDAMTCPDVQWAITPSLVSPTN